MRSPTPRWRIASNASCTVITSCNVAKSGRATVMTDCSQCSCLLSMKKCYQTANVTTGLFLQINKRKRSALPVKVHGLRFACHHSPTAYIRCVLPTAALRVIVFLLAFLSFACLLGQFFHVWTMHFFGCWILPPATALLAFIAFTARRCPPGVLSPHTWIVQGALGGVVAAVAYDLYRLPFVLGGAPLFK